MTLKGKLNTAMLSISLAILACTAISTADSSEEKTRMINKATPILHVRAVEPGLKFWNERFGFKTTIQVPEGDHIGFAAIENGSIELMYQTYEGMKKDASNPLAKTADQGPSFIFMEVRDINAVIEALQGAEIVQGLHETFYGAKEVVAKEPGGHFVIFSQLPKPPQQ
jgi:uncharacterized glyoxalase superfamily protein PhnB